MALSKILLHPTDNLLVSSAFQRRAEQREEQRIRLLEAKKKRKLGVETRVPTSIRPDSFVHVLGLFGGMLSSEQKLIVVRDLGGGKAGGVFKTQGGTSQQALLQGPDEAIKVLKSSKAALVIVGAGDGNRTIALSRTANGKPSFFQILPHVRQTLRAAEAECTDAEIAIETAANENLSLAGERLEALDVARLRRLGQWLLRASLSS